MCFDCNRKVPAIQITETIQNMMHDTWVAINLMRLNLVDWEFKAK